MQALDTTILNTAVPVVSKALDVSPLAMRAVLASYALSFAVFIPISGWMADRFGTRRVFAWAIGLFTFGSVLCGLTQQHPSSGCLPRDPGLRRRHDGAGRAAYARAHVRQIRA
jgi:MFS family permease